MTAIGIWRYEVNAGQTCGVPDAAICFIVLSGENYVNILVSCQFIIFSNDYLLVLYFVPDVAFCEPLGAIRLYLLSLPLVLARFV